MPIDPVCGMEVNEQAKDKSEYEGRMYYFCSRDCKEEFDEVPEDYTATEE